jgi:O-antigen ligase
MASVLATIQLPGKRLLPVGSDGAASVSKKGAIQVSGAEFLFYAVILTLPFEQLLTIGGGAITKWIGLLFFVLSVSEIKTFYTSFPTPFLFYFSYVAIGIAGDLIRFPLNVSILNETMQPALNGVLMLAAYNLCRNRGFFRLVLVLAVSIALFSLFQVFNLAPGAATSSLQVLDGNSMDRVSALNTDPNFSACFMALGVIPGVLAASGALFRGGLGKTAILSSSVLAAGGILMTGSRGGLLALVAGIAAIVLVAPRMIVRIKLVLASTLVLGLFVAILMNNPLFMGRLENSIEKRDTAHREDIWRESLSLAAESPLFGYGYRSYIYDLGRVRGEPMRGTHNLQLSVLLGAGGAGFMAFLIFYLAAVRSVWRHRKTTFGMILFPWFVACFVASLSLNLEISKWYWLVTTLALALPDSREEINRRLGQAAPATGIQGLRMSFGRSDPAWVGRQMSVQPGLPVYHPAGTAPGSRVAAFRRNR